MPIQFRCSQCSRSLRVPDGTSGRQARCPECGTIVRIPAQTDDERQARETPPQTPLPEPPRAASRPPQAPVAAQENTNAPEPSAQPETTEPPEPGETAASSQPAPRGRPSIEGRESRTPDAADTSPFFAASPFGADIPIPPPPGATASFGADMPLPPPHDTFAGDQTPSWATGTPFGADMPLPVPPGAAVPPPPPPRTGLDYENRNPYQSPAYVPAQHEQGEPPGPITPTQVSFGEFLGRAWRIYQARWAIVLGLLFLTALCSGGVSVMVALPLQVAALALSDGTPVGAGTFLVFSSALQIVVNTFFHLGLLQCLLDVSRGREVDFGALFTGGAKLPRALAGLFLWALAGVGILVVVAGGGLLMIAVAGLEPRAPLALGAVLGVGLWTMLWSLVAAILALTFGFFMPAIVDRDAGVIESYAISRRITAGNRWTLFAVWLALPLAGIVVGMGAFGVIVVAAQLEAVAMVLIGVLLLMLYFAAVVFVLVPLSAIFYATAYLSMSGQPIGHQEGARRYAVEGFSTSPFAVDAVDPDSDYWR